jgi:protease I
MVAISGKKVCLVIAPSNFRDEELLDTRKELERAGATITVVSTHTDPVKGMLGATARPDGLISSVRAENFDAVVFIGGSGATALFDDPSAHTLAQGALRSGKLLGAICIAPSILARAGLLRGKKATVFKGERFVRIMQEGGARYTGDPVTVDGRIVTADGPASAGRFARALVSELAKS